MRKMFAVCDECGAKSIYGIYPTLADAEEAIFTECEYYAYWMMMTVDPRDAIGEWDWYWDRKFFMCEAGRTFYIQEVSVFC